MLEQKQEEGQKVKPAKEAMFLAADFLDSEVYAGYSVIPVSDDFKIKVKEDKRVYVDETGVIGESDKGKCSFFNSKEGAEARIQEMKKPERWEIMVSWIVHSKKLPGPVRRMDSPFEMEEE